MNILKNKGLKYGDYLLESLSYWYADDEDKYIMVETFYNCREQGYVLEVQSNKDYNKAICIWVCAQRNSDDPMIVWEETQLPKEVANMFSEDSYYNRTECFNNIDQAFHRVVKIINDYFKNK